MGGVGEQFQNLQRAPKMLGLALLPECLFLDATGQHIIHFPTALLITVTCS